MHIALFLLCFVICCGYVVSGW